MQRQKITLYEIAERIDVHLKRFASANKSEFYKPCSNIDKLNLHKAHEIVVIYDDNNAAYLTKSEAIVYLTWLDAGNVGKHWGLSDT